MKKIANSEKGWDAIYVLVFLSFITSMGAWIGWNQRQHFINVFIFISFLTLYIKGKFRLFPTDRYKIAVFIYFITYLYIKQSQGILGVAVAIFTTLPLYFMLCIPDSKKIICLHYISKWYAYLMVLGMIIYVLFFFINLPPIGTITLNETSIGIKANAYVFRDNYIFLVPIVKGYVGSVPRFNGPFIEPGHLGMISAFLLFANHFDFKAKRYLWFILLSVIVSLSMAGYVLTFVGFIFSSYYKGKTSLVKLLLFLVVLGAFYLLGMYYNGGDNLINDKILSRLDDESEFNLVDNHRTFGLIVSYYNKMWNDMGTVIWGYGRETISYLAVNGSRGTGWVMWMVSFGIVGLICALLFYTIFLFKAKAGKYAFLFFIIIILSFIQRSYSFWTSWVICYVYGIVLAEYKQKLGYENRNLNVS